MTLTPPPPGTPKRTISKEELDRYIGSAIAEIKKKNPGTAVNTGMMQNTVRSESGGPDKNGRIPVAANAYKPRQDGTYAWGIGQMFPEAVATAHQYLTGQSISGAAMWEQWEKVVQDPEQSVRYSTALYASIEKTIQGWSVVKSKVHDPNHIRAIASACYHVGEKRVKPMVESACEGGSFNITTFVQLYEGTSARLENGRASDRVRKEAGIGGSPEPGPAGSGGSSGGDAPPQIVPTGPSVWDAAINQAIPLSFDVAGSTPITPLQLIQEGLDVAAWFDGDSSLPGKVTANPHLRGVPAPAWFELRMNRTDGKSLTSPTTGQILKVMLNVSLTSVNTRSQHLVNREPTATGIMVSFWGSQPDIITGRGTTGAFINQTGLTALMSNRLTPVASGWWDMIQQAYGKREMPSWEQTSTGMGRLGMTRMWGIDGKGTNRFRVAAQDAFAEMLALFKNNGVIRFLPQSWMEAQKDKSTLTDALKNKDSWSPAAGATGFQMLARAGDVHARGYVVFKYKGATYLGYFKSFNFTADAKNPFKWDFDFTFRVLKSLTPFYHHATKLGGANG